MDYKYIEQLMERYWNCGTSLEEEQILRSFFRQQDLPAHLLRYKALFACQEAEKERGLGDDFDAKVLARVERPVVKARRLTLRVRLMPLFKAAGMVAALLLTGTVMQRSMDDGGGVVYVYDEYGDTATDPQVAYDPVLPMDTVAKRAEGKGRAEGKELK